MKQNWVIMKTRNKNLAPLQFITLENTEVSEIQQAEKVLKAGCKLIQLRIKNKPMEEIKSIAEKILKLTKQYSAKLLINDYVNMASEINADGVHLGKKDMSPAKAREILSPSKIIGGTANTINDILNLIKTDVDYIGLGPFKYTSTKKNLDTILGLDGYKRIVTELKAKKITTPIFAIGGISVNDVEGIFNTGITRFAISSAIAKSENIELKLFEFKTKIDKHHEKIKNSK